MKRGYRILLSLHAGAPIQLVEQALEALWPGMAEELVGLFIEDTELLELTRLPVAREIRQDGTPPCAPDRAGLERELRAQAERLRQAFEQRARHLARRCAFRVARRSPAALLRESGEDFDVLLLADSPDRLEYHWAVRRQLAFVVRGGPPLVVIARPLQRFARRIAILWDPASAGARRSLETACEIAASAALEVLLLPLPGSSTDPEDLQRLMQQAGAGLAWRSRPLAALSPEALASALQAEGAAFLVMSRDSAGIDEAFIAEAVDRVRCTVILTS